MGRTKNANTNRHKYPFSALIFPNSKPAKALLHSANNHEIILCKQNITELFDILNRKTPNFVPAAETLLKEMSYTLIPTVKMTKQKIRDMKDQPILNAAITSNVDIIITGDKDFLSLDIKRPKCMTAAEFLEFENIE